MIRLEGVTKRYGQFVAVQPLDLQVPRGELFGFLGPNGAGKTTTIRMIAGTLRPSGGRITIAGYDMATSSLEARRRIGYIPDRPYLYEKLTGSEFLRFVGGLWGRRAPRSNDAPSSYSNSSISSPGRIHRSRAITMGCARSC